jgi:hypothetical protein
MASGNPFHIDQRLRRFDGEYRWFDNRGVPVRDDSGRIARWYCLLTDIEDRTRALARLDQMRSDLAHVNRLSVMGDPERIERVFDAFYTTKASGVGMGLAICRSILDAHGGRLWAEANAPRGAVFQFTLPSPERSS